MEIEIKKDPARQEEGTVVGTTQGKKKKKKKKKTDDISSLNQNPTEKNAQKKSHDEPLKKKKKKKLDAKLGESKSNDTSSLNPCSPQSALSKKRKSHKRTSVTKSNDSTVGSPDGSLKKKAGVATAISLPFENAEKQSKDKDCSTESVVSQKKKSRKSKSHKRTSVTKSNDATVGSPDESLKKKAGVATAISFPLENAEKQNNNKDCSTESVVSQKKKSRKSKSHKRTSVAKSNDSTVGSPDGSLKKKVGVATAISLPFENAEKQSKDKDCSTESVVSQKKKSRKSKSHKRTSVAKSNDSTVGSPDGSLKKKKKSRKSKSQKRTSVTKSNDSTVRSPGGSSKKLGATTTISFPFENAEKQSSDIHPKEEHSVFVLQPSNFILESEKLLASRPVRKTKRSTMPRKESTAMSASSPSYGTTSPSNYRSFYSLRSGIGCGLPAGVYAGI